ncbi:MAG TPA: transposase [Segetibacter sp.]
MKEAKVKLEIKQKRYFSEEFKKARVKDLVEKRVTVLEVSRLHEVSTVAVYKWLYKYSVHHQRQTTLVVQMESEATKTKSLLQQVADLERVIGQKQLEIDFLSKLLEIGSEEMGFDLKKNFSSRLLSGTGSAKGSTTTT